MNFFTPAEVAKNYIATGKGKVNTTIGKMLILAVLAGVFIALAGVASATASVSVPQASVGKFLGACVFPGGLTMVLLAGSELFTGNTLLVIPLFQREITWKGMLKKLAVCLCWKPFGVHSGCGGCGLLHAALDCDNGLAVSVLSTAAAKCAMPFGQGFCQRDLLQFPGLHRRVDFLCGQRCDQQDCRAVFPHHVFRGVRV